jgi:excisionase family DNA binding protein
MSAKKVLTKAVEEACAVRPEAAEPPDHLKIPEVCKRLRLGRTAVYGLMERGELPYLKFGRARRVDRRHLEEYIRRSTVPARV